MPVELTYACGHAWVRAWGRRQAAGGRNRRAACLASLLACETLYLCVLAPTASLPLVPPLHLLLHVHARVNGCRGRLIMCPYRFVLFC